MPRKSFKGWEGAPNYRWRKMRHGETFTISCRELGLPESLWTEEGSREAAKTWWDTITGPTKLQQTINATIGAVQPEDLKSIIEKAITARAILQAGPLDNLQAEDIDEIIGIGPLDDSRRIELLATTASRLGTKATETKNRLGSQLENFLSLQRARNKKPRTYGELSTELTRLVKTAPLTEDMDARKIDEQTVQAVYVSLKQRQPATEPHRKKVWGFWLRLIRHLWTNRIIELPRNLDDPIFSFETSAKEIPLIPLATVQDCLQQLPDHLRLYALLGLNCAMLGVDIGNLKKEEVDLEAGRITRRRTKVESGPKVSYKLWPETLALLKQFWSKHDVLALTSLRGTKLHDYWTDENGKEKEKDLIRQQWRDGSPRPKLHHKAFRTFGAQLIRQAQELGGAIEYTAHYAYYLAHSPKAMADKFYAPPSAPLFDEILGWIRKVILQKRK